MTVAAVYARKSTSQDGVADEERSVARQVEHARSFAEKQGWTVAEDYVFSDDAASGGEFATREGYVRLLASLKPRPPFQVLIVSELSRLGREQLETGFACKQLSQAGVRIYGYLDGKEVQLDSSTDRFLLSALNFASEVEREQAAARTKDALERKARRGHVTGGRTFGFDNVEVKNPDGTRSHVERRINDEEAAVVRKIFELAAGGMGKTRIAHTLNEEGAASPQSQQGRPKGWAPSSVGVVLHRQSYRGILLYNQTQKRDQWGQRKGRPKPRPSSEHIRVEMPELRIVDEELWEKVQARLEKARKQYLRRTDGKLWGRPPGGEKGRHLLAGYALCGDCGAGLEVVSRSHGKRRVRFYVCSARRRKGKTVCTNETHIPMKLADEAVIAALVEGVLEPGVLRRVAERAIELLQESARPEEREQVAKQLRETERALERLTAAVAAGGDVPSLVEAIKVQEERRKTLAQRMEAIAQPPVRFDASMRERIEQEVDEWRSLLTQEVPIARQIVGKLLDEKLAFRPEERNGEKGWAFAGRGTIERLIAGAMPQRVHCVVSPTGFEPVLPA